MRQTLSLDVGNTRLKLAFFQGDDIQFRTETETKQFKSLKSRQAFAASLVSELKARSLQVEKIILSSVVPEVARLIANTLERTFKRRVLTVSTELNLPFEHRYKTPHTLGADRLALVAYAVKRFPKAATIAIDFGTAITYEIVTSRKVYLGGVILSGFGVSLSALHSHTAQLPEVRFSSQTKLVGESTNECLERGAYWGAVAQTEGLIARFKSFLKTHYGEKRIKVMVTGGDAPLIAEQLKFDEINEYAVLEGAAYLADLN
ncbi:MAG: type III pantothenate kinase [Chloroherpetonaceae bacterium]